MGGGSWPRRPTSCSRPTASGPASQACISWRGTTPDSYPCPMRIAILGVGKIGESLLAGLHSSGWDDLVGTVRHEERAAEIRERHGVETTTSNRDAVEGADV